LINKGLRLGRRGVFFPHFGGDANDAGTVAGFMDPNSPDAAMTSAISGFFIAQFFAEMATVARGPRSQRKE
jgi:hypothetical protein